MMIIITIKNFLLTRNHCHFHHFKEFCVDVSTYEPVEWVEEEEETCETVFVKVLGDDFGIGMIFVVAGVQGEDGGGVRRCLGDPL